MYDVYEGINNIIIIVQFICIIIYYIKDRHVKSHTFGTYSVEVVNKRYHESLISFNERGRTTIEKWIKYTSVKLIILNYTEISFIS